MTARNIVRDVLAGRRVAADVDTLGLGLPSLPDDFAELRWILTDDEIVRYRQGAKLAAQAMEDACNDISPGDSEHDIAGVIDDYIRRTGANPVVTLVATDDRVFQFRHPIPTSKKLQRYAMLVTCAEYNGLISNLTRFVYFGTLSDDLRTKQQAVCNVDTAINLATRPGRTVAELFRVLQQAYADNGFADQWQLHHQGGPTGYAPREAIADPTSLLTVHENQAFAWNPSIAGTKSENTIIVTSNGIEVLTAHSTNWPSVQGSHGQATLSRAGILVR
jgi:Xaa-Pro aminopeptidase